MWLHFIVSPRPVVLTLLINDLIKVAYIKTPL